MNDLSERLARREIVILDGAISTEIQRCGMALDAISGASCATLKCPD